MSELAKSPSLSTSGDVLLILARREGLFSLVFQVLGLAHLAEKAGLTPVVYFNRQCLYWSDQGYQGSRNVWEYFFEPLSSVKIENLFSLDTIVSEDLSLEQFRELTRGTRVKVTNTYPDVVEYWSPLGIQSERNFVHRLMSKYMVFKPVIRAKADAYSQSCFGPNSVIGVHYRGQEKASGSDGVVRGRTRELKRAFFREMRSQIERRPGSRLFVATDSASFLDEAKEAFGDAVLFREARRLPTDNESVGLHFTSDAQKYGAVLAEEVLIDALLLARTNCFIHGISNVSNAVLYMNPQLEHTDIELRTTPGTIYLRREFFRRLEKLLPGPVRFTKRLLGRSQIAPW